MNAPTLLGPNRSRRLSLLTALLLLAALTSACTFEVQPIEEYTSPDGYLSFTFPAAWDVLEEESGNGMTSALVGTHPDSRQHGRDARPPRPASRSCSCPTSCRDRTAKPFPCRRKRWPTSCAKAP